MATVSQDISRLAFELNAVRSDGDKFSADSVEAARLWQWVDESLVTIVDAIAGALAEHRDDELSVGAATANAALATHINEVVAAVDVLLEDPRVARTPTGDRLVICAIWALTAMDAGREDPF